MLYYKSTCEVVDYDNFTILFLELFRINQDLNSSTFIKMKQTKITIHTIYKIKLNYFIYFIFRNILMK